MPTTTTLFLLVGDDLRPRYGGGDPKTVQKHSPRPKAAVGSAHCRVVQLGHLLQLPGHFQAPATATVRGFDRYAFPDLLRSVDVVLTKPGYGTFTEAACNGAAVLYLRRDDWPEQDCLIEWLETNARCLELGEVDLASPRLPALLEALWRKPMRTVPIAARRKSLS